MTHQDLARTLRGRTLRVAAAGSAIAAAAALGGLSATASAHPAPDSGITAYDEAPVTGTDQTIEEGAQGRGDDAWSAPTGGSVTGLAHSQRWHAAAAHARNALRTATDDSAEATDDNTAGEDSSSEDAGTPAPPTTSEPGDDQGDDEQGDDQGDDDQGEHAGDGDHSGDQAGDEHSDDGDHEGDHSGDGDHQGDGDHSGGDGEHEGD